ncbi:MAG: RcpC/CpaB family pilus assembly protein [Hyphomicrobiales bacterium]|nr:RcpC/CpaB family pilus assembly protein [Hyphomicrobiales bacterium]
MIRQQSTLLAIAAVSAIASGALVHRVLTAAAHAPSVVPPAKPLATLADRIAPHKRAAVVPLKDDAGVGAHITVGDRVDVILTRAAAGRRVESETVLRGLRVLSAGGEGKTGFGPRAPGVTVEVSEAEAVVLANARASGKIALTLAGPDDAVASGEGRASQRPVRVVKFGAAATVRHD